MPLSPRPFSDTCVCSESFSAMTCHHLAAHDVGIKLVPGTGIEPARYQVPADFETDGSEPEDDVNQ